MDHCVDTLERNAGLREADLTEPVTYGVEAFLARDYAGQEKERLWPWVWQHACRLEEVANIGDFVTYEIGDDSVIVVRTAENELSAYHNVCPHRGRRLIDTPAGQHCASGNRKGITCGFHGWSFVLDGANTFILDKQDWKGCLEDPARTQLSKIQVDSWGGWVFINMDPECGPLRDYLEPAASILDPFELEMMRYKWRQWVVFDCNWRPPSKPSWSPTTSPARIRRCLRTRITILTAPRMGFMG